MAMPGRCYKVSFASQAEATDALRSAKRQGRAEQHVYYCRICSAYHLTSKDNKPHPPPRPAYMRKKRHE